MHLDEELRERLLHGELPHDLEASARAHLAACPDCRRALDDSEREQETVHALLRTLDDPFPAIDLESVLARARPGSTGALSPAAFRLSRSRRRTAPLVRWAAGIALAILAAGVAYAWPGSPVPTWLTLARTRLISPGERSGAVEVPPPPIAAEPPEAGVAVTPGRAFVIRFASPQAQGEIRVMLVEGGQVVVRAPAGAARYSSDPAHLGIDNRGSRYSFEIRIPQSAPRVEIFVGGERVLLKEGSRLTGAGVNGVYPLSVVR